MSAARSLHPLAAEGIACSFDPDCGLICDLVVTDQGRKVDLLHRAQWIGEDLPSDLPPHLPRLQGDFFCAPFADGGGSAHILHGWPANAVWTVDPAATGAAHLLAIMPHPVQGARLTKALRLLDGHPFLYQSHLFEGGEGTISAANHAMVSLPEGGLLSFSPRADFRTPATAPEPDPARGRSALAYPARSADAARFPTADGGPADLTRYPFRPLHEDFVVATEAANSPLGWTAVVRIGRGDLFLSLRNPAQLPATMLWHSDGGRDYLPWSGRHRGCLGVEEGYAPHMLGEPGGFPLGGRIDLRHAIGAIAWPEAVRVTAVEAGPDHLVIRGEGGALRRVPFDTGHLFP
jgi:hypothetical protein